MTLVAETGISYKAVNEDWFDVDRVFDAVKPSTESYSMEGEIDAGKLSKMASKTNAAGFWHYTGNCVLLSRCFLYNMIHKTLSFVVNNTKKWWKGISTDIMDTFLFHKELTEVSGDYTDVDSLTWRLLYEYKKNKENSCFIIRVERQVFGLELGHDFNAVIVLDKEGKPQVVFVDPWRTYRRNVMTVDELAKKFLPDHQTFGILKLFD
jgi:salmonella plasmid virulence protein D